MPYTDKIRILSLDGGGIRGIIPGAVLAHVENKIKEFSENREAYLAEYFDLVVGTSTGGILGAMLLAPKSADDLSSRFTALDAYSLYMDHGTSIFNDSKRSIGFLRIFRNAAKYKRERLDELLKDRLGDLTMSQLLKPCVITTYDLKAKEAVFFNSREQDTTKGDFYLRDVLRSTSAGPTYFDPVQIQNIQTQGAVPMEMVNIDGGVFANNPAMCAYAECRRTYFPFWKDQFDPTKRFPTAKNMLILSIGTGGGNFKLPNIQSSQNWNLINWAKATPNIMLDAGFDTVDYQIRQVFNSLPDDKDKLNLKRVDFPKNEDGSVPYEPDMAEASHENIRALAKAGAETVFHANQDKPNERTLDAFIRELVNLGPRKAEPEGLV